MSLRQYIYKPEQAGLTAWPPGELRLPGLEVVNSPSSADIFVCPGDRRLFRSTDDLSNRLQFFRQNPARHVFFDCCEDWMVFNSPAVFIRCNTLKHFFDSDPNTISWPWPVESCGECVPVPSEGFTFDISFHGWIKSHPAREIATEACLGTSGIIFDYSGYRDFFGYLKEGNPEYWRRRIAYRDSLRRSRVALCPQSIVGIFPYRFYEAMSAGRIPILVGEDFSYPFADEIPYGQFSLELPTATPNLGQVILNFIRSHSDSEIIAKGQLARHYWEHYLDRDQWPRLMQYAVEKKFAAVLTERV